MGGRSRAHATRRDANHDARNDAHGRGRGDTHGAHRQRGARARSTAAAVRGASRRGGGHLGIDVGARIPRATRAINANLPGGGALVGGGRVRQATLLPATIRHVAALEGGYRRLKRSPRGRAFSRGVWNQPCAICRRCEFNTNSIRVLPPPAPPRANRGAHARAHCRAETRPGRRRHQTEWIR